MTVTSLAGVRQRPPLTVALVGSPCWVADALADALAAGGDRVLRVAGSEDEGTTAAGCGADVVVHVATGPQERSLRGRSEPALLTLAALHAARVDGARLVIASLPGHAAHLPAALALAEGFRSAGEVETVVVRLAECYGPGMPAGRTGVLARMLDQARTDGTVVVAAGDEEEHRVCFVDDAVAGLVQVVRGAGAGPFVLAPTSAVRTLELARAVAEATGTTCRVRERRRLRVAPSLPARAAGRSSGDPSADPVAGAGAPEGWRCEVDLAEGLARCVQRDGAAVAGESDARESLAELRTTAVALGGDVA